MFSSFKNSVDPDQLADEASWSGSTLVHIHSESFYNYEKNITAMGWLESKKFMLYSKTCVKRPLIKIQNKDLDDKQ